MPRQVKNFRNTVSNSNPVDCFEVLNAKGNIPVSRGRLYQISEAKKQQIVQKEQKRIQKARENAEKKKQQQALKLRRALNKLRKQQESRKKAIDRQLKKNEAKVRKERKLAEKRLKEQKKKLKKVGTPR